MQNIEEARALVLNADFRPLRLAPISTYSWQEAVAAVMSDTVIVLSEYDIKARSPSISVRIPSVVAIKTYVDLDRPAAITRQNLYAWYGAWCAYCGETFPTSELTIDHVIPRGSYEKERRHEANVAENLVLACTTCNGRKGCRTPKQAGMQLRVTPHHPTVAQINARAARFLHRDVMPKSWLDWIYWTSELEA